MKVVRPLFKAGAAFLTALFASTAASTPETPSSIRQHKPCTSPRVWTLYTMKELGDWVHLFSRQARHRKDLVGFLNDMASAQHYLDLMQTKLNAIREEFNA